MRGRLSDDRLKKIRLEVQDQFALTNAIMYRSVSMDTPSRWIFEAKDPSGTIVSSCRGPQENVAVLLGIVAHGARMFYSSMFILKVNIQILSYFSNVAVLFRYDAHYSLPQASWDFFSGECND